MVSKEFNTETKLTTSSNSHHDKSSHRLASKRTLYPDDDLAPVVVTGRNLSIDEVVRVARKGAPVKITEDQAILDCVEAACEFVAKAVDEERPIYGITTGFGGMADKVISREMATDLQNNAIWLHKTGAGKWLPLEDVRAAMMLRLNSHLRGFSGVRLEILRRIELFLNENVTPHVPELGSIGASGDLVPLTYITGCLIGLDACFTVDFRGEVIDSVTALERLGVPRLRLLPKEGLAMINGTSVMTGIAANCVYQAQTLLALAMGVHGLAVQALMGTNQSFHPFIHDCKPHPGQVWAASQMLTLLEGSQLSRDELHGKHEHRLNELIQDRYSLRCLPQYMGPIVDGLAQIGQQVEVEMNSVNDNPLIDVENDACYHGGNFLGQYIGVAMDQLRYYIGLLAKHIDVQIALLVSPKFSKGLSGSLVGNTARPVNMGLKGLQLAGNSIMPLLTFLGNSLVDRFPTHAEQFNQNVNSQGFGSANMARQSVEMCQQYMAIALIFGVQAVDLRTHGVLGHYDARAALSPALVPLYEAICEVVGRMPSAERPYVWNDNEQVLDAHIAQIAYDVAKDGRIASTIRAVVFDDAVVGDLGGQSSD